MDLENLLNSWNFIPSHFILSMKIQCWFHFYTLLSDAEDSTALDFSP